MARRKWRSDSAQDQSYTALTQPRAVWTAARPVSDCPGTEASAASSRARAAVAFAFGMTSDGGRIP